MPLSVTSITTFIDQCQAKSYLIDVVGLPDRPSLPALLGSLGHDIISGLHPKKIGENPKFSSLDKALKAFSERWEEKVKANKIAMKFYSKQMDEKFFARGELGIRNYASENLIGFRPIPYYNEAYRRVEIAGQNVTVKFDLAVLVDVEDAKSFRPELIRNEKIPYMHTPHIIIDHKFGKRDPSYTGRHIRGNMYECSMDSFTSSEKRQSTNYVMGYIWANKHKLKSGEYRFRSPLGFIFYYPAQQIAGFVHPRKQDYDLAKAEIRAMAKVIAKKSWQRVLDDEKCMHCNFRTDCRGKNDELVGVPLEKLPSVLRGIPDWQYKLKFNIAGTQTRMPF